MTPEQRQIMEEKKQKLKLEIQFNNFQQSSILPFIEILDELDKLEIWYNIHSISHIQNEWKESLNTSLENAPLSKFHISGIPFTSGNPLIEKLMEIYTSSNPFRYVPEHPIIGIYESDVSQLLSTLIKKENFDIEVVFLFYFRYAFILKINLSDLAKKASEELFNLWNGDTVIFPENYSWLISYSIEEKWRFGR